ncbi:hypothetical protein CRD60_04515 [Bifidobacterium aemilianum]|uniref:Uncharacterized protein n=1 Tax=Bifidobacterium aemilianum TaxID=2493120 RepID=A0A366K858_9BIFI|nr:hypothetical protein [Bifidobacterium aemilianum]RBP97854.1 hypothetical protein CRD60_04515 [Bifidobacterium aemilianum]
MVKTALRKFAQDKKTSCCADMNTGQIIVLMLKLGSFALKLFLEVSIRPEPKAKHAKSRKGLRPWIQWLVGLVSLILDLIGEILTWL